MVVHIAAEEKAFAQCALRERAIGQRIRYLGSSPSSAINCPGDPGQVTSPSRTSVSFKTRVLDQINISQRVLHGTPALWDGCTQKFMKKEGSVTVQQSRTGFSPAELPRALDVLTCLRNMHEEGGECHIIQIT